MNIRIATITLVTLVTIGSSGCALSKESRYLANITQLTSQDMGLFNAGEAYFSPDAKTIIFQGTPIGQSEYQIYTLDLQTRKLSMVSTGKGACTCAFFNPNGKKIIFASSHLDPNVDQPKQTNQEEGYKWDFNKHMDVFEADPTGSNLRRITREPGYDAECAYSPDGQRIVFTSQRDGDLELYVMDADGANQHRLTFTPGYDGGPFFSPDSQHIIYRADHRDDGLMNLQLRIMNADGTNDRAITDNPVFNWCPYWYPTGKSLIFTQADHMAYAHGGKTNYDLYMTTPEGESFIRITDNPEFDGLPVFSPDGTKLLWTSKRDGMDQPQLFIADFAIPKEFTNAK